MSGGDWKTMFKAIQENDLELVNYYLHLGMDPNYQHPEVLALPLSESVRYANDDITKLLLSYGAKISIVEIETGITTRELAKQLKNESVIEMFDSIV